MFKYLFFIIIVCGAFYTLLFVWPGEFGQKVEAGTVKMPWEKGDEVALTGDDQVVDGEKKGFFSFITGLFDKSLPEVDSGEFEEPLESVVASPKTVEEAQAPPEEPSTYPLNMSLSNADGTSLDVQIIGRSDHEVTFIRDSDRKSFTYPISSLSQVDSAAVGALPVTMADEIESGAQLQKSTIEPVEDWNVARLEERLLETLEESKAPDLTTGQKQILARKIRDLTEDLQKAANRK